MAKGKIASQEDRLKRNEEKWSLTLMEAGWTVLPSVILDRQRALGLDAIDVNIIMHLAKHWWYADRPPYPTKKSIAECMGIDSSTVRRHIARLEKDGLIQRKPRSDKAHGQMANEYIFDGLIKEATPFAEEAIDEKRVKQEAASARRKRKRPVLSVVDNENNRSQ